MRSNRLSTFFAASIALNLILAAVLIGTSFNRNPRPKIRSVEIIERSDSSKGLAVSFNTPMETSEEICPVKIVPGIKQIHKWSSPKKLSIAFLDPIPPGKNLVVLPKSQQKDKEGKKLKSTPVEVSTPPLKLVRLDGPTQTESGKLHLLLCFSGRVKPDDLKKHFSVSSPDGRTIPFRLISGDLSVNHTVVFQDPGQDVQKVHYKLKKGLLAAGGEIPMANDDSGTVQLPDALTVGLLKGNQSGRAICIDFKLSSKTALNRLSKAISIDPKVAFKVSRRWSGNYRLTGDFSPRTFYRLTFAKGLVSLNGNALKETLSRTVVTPALPSSFQFMTRGPVLPFSPDASLPFQACNISRIELKAWRLFPNNIQTFFRNGENDPEKYGSAAGEFTLDVPLAQDRKHTIQVPVEQVLSDYRPGVYVLKTQDPKTWWRQETRTVVLTNIGLVAHTSGTAGTFWARSLQDNHPIPGCLLQVISRRNQELGQAVTGSDGSAYIAFDPSLKSEEPYLVIAACAGDLSVMKLSETSHGLQAFSVHGTRSGSESYEGFIYSDRGIYRGGETVQLSCLARTRTLTAAAQLPAQIDVMDPTGNRFFSQPIILDASGYKQISVAIPDHARSGTYTVKLTSPGIRAIWGTGTFRVGAFMPDRMKVEMKLNCSEAGGGDDISLMVRSQYYFGAPAASCRGTIQARLQDQAFSLRQFPGFSFGDGTKPNITTTIFSEKVETDEQGEKKVSFQIPGNLDPGGALRLQIIGAIQEPGGRTVSAGKTIPVHIHPYYIGLKYGTNQLKEPFVSWVLAPPSPSLNPDFPEVVKIELYELSWERILVKSAGSYHYDWQLKKDKVQEQTVATHGETMGDCTFTRIPGGQYEVVARVAGTRVSTRLRFWHWAGGEDSHPTQVSHLPLETDRNQYRPGDEARLTFAVPGPGAVMITGGTGTGEFSLSRACKAGRNTITIRIPELSVGTFYLGVTFVADLTDTQLPLPRRLFGLKRLDLNQQKHFLNTRLTFPETAEPGRSIPVDIEVSREGKPEAARVHLYAVDEGILSLTGYSTPDPFSFFYGDRTCSLRFSDLYDNLFPNLTIDGRKSTSGGDAAVSLAQRLSPVPIEHTASAVVTLPVAEIPPSGKQRVWLPVPEFTGSMRLIAVAFNRDAVGAADADLTVRKKATILASAPLFAAPGDTFEITLQAINHDAEGKEARIDVSLDGPGNLIPSSESSTFALPPGTEIRRLHTVRIDPKQSGILSFSARLSIGKVTDTADVKITVRPPSPPVFIGEYVALAAGGSQTLEFADQWFPGTFTSSLEISTSPFVELAPATNWLRAYPYGCLEQTASAAFALPYYGILIAPHGKITDDDRKALLNELNRAVRRIYLMEVFGGGFSTWPGGRKRWHSGSVFAAHFLAEAKAFGASVDSGLWSRTLDYLKALAAGKYAEAALADRAYALCLLTRARQPETGIAYGMTEDEACPLFSRFLAALSLIGTSRSEDGLDKVENWLGGTYAQGRASWDMDSDLRRHALVVNLLLDLMPEHPRIDRLIEMIRREKQASGHWGTTQNNSLAIMALGKYLTRYPPDPGTTGRLVIAGETTTLAEKAIFKHTMKQPANVQVASDGPGSIFVSSSTFGVPNNISTEPVSRGLQIRRQYLDENGDPKVIFEQGELVRIKLTVKTPRSYNNVVIVDLLPGGLEIEDDSLSTRWSPADRKQNLSTAAIEKRDDRLLLFCSLRKKQNSPCVFIYTARAVTRGKFVIPRVSAECMYQPDIRAESGDLTPLTIE